MMQFFKGLIIWMAVGLVLMALIGFSNRTDLYENMVNASVLMWDDDGSYSGVFIVDNVIATAAHCLKEGEAVTIRLRDGTILNSNSFYIDKEEDVGFVFVEADELFVAKVSSIPARLGEPVYLVGTPYKKSFTFTLTKGIISHLDRDLPRFGWKDILQSDVAGGRGCSGGPLYNSDGIIVGMYVGQFGNGDKNLSFCESAKSILEAYERCKDATHTKRN